MNSPKYTFIKTMFKLNKITAVEVWQYADDGIITELEATMICGLRPENE